MAEMYGDNMFEDGVIRDVISIYKHYVGSDIPVDVNIVLNDKICLFNYEDKVNDYKTITIRREDVVK